MSEREQLMSAEQAERLAQLVKSAEAGDGSAACQLGDMYREGLGGLRYSPRETYRWYARSAMAVDDCGQNNLGACYEHGIGCRQSYAKAVKWYRLAAAQQVGTASMNLGYCYLRGKAVPEDRAEALRLFRLAVTQGEPKAAEELERLGEPDQVTGTGKASRIRDVTVNGRQFGIIGGIPRPAGEQTPAPPTKKKHVPVDDPRGFDFYWRQGCEPEEFDTETEPRYRAYLASKGVTKEDLERKRRWVDLERRAWEKDDCFDLPPEGSAYHKRLLEQRADFNAMRMAGKAEADAAALAAKEEDAG